MRVLTLNIRFGAGSESPEKQGYNVPVSGKKITALSAAIQSVQPDIVALQEVKSERQTQRIASRVNLQYIYCRHPSSYSLDFFEWGIAFLFRLKLIRSAGASTYFDKNVRSGRQALLASFQVKDKLITIINLHLIPHAIDLQIQKVITLAEQSNTPTILIGDFNCTPDNPALKPLKYKWLDTCQEAITTPGGTEADSIGTFMGNTKRIDYIFVDRDCFSICEVGLLPEAHRRISDHIGYFADIDLKTP
jgi:endonuclease/exonuclease/phosphatase family metal-dependent hydrolase